MKVKIKYVYVISYIHSHKGLFPYIQMATITTFWGTSPIPDWKLVWIDEKVSPLALNLAKTYQI